MEDLNQSRGELHYVSRSSTLISSNNENKHVYFIKITS